MAKKVRKASKATAAKSGAANGSVRRTKRRQWTIMIYMAAGDSAELDAHAVRDLREMENGVNEFANVVVQINRSWPDAPQRYQIRRKRRVAGKPLSRGGESVHADKDATFTNMGDPDTLLEFLNWASRAYRAEHYMLVLWGHSYGLGFGRDHNDPLTLKELTTALKAFKNSLGGKKRLDILGANACAMSYVEAAFELRECAQYLVASQVSVPFAGWPYDGILRKIGSSTNPLELCQIIIDTYTSRLNTPLTGARVQMSILNLENAGRALRDNLAKLAAAIQRELAVGNPDRLMPIRDAFLSTVAGDVRPLIDAFDLCSALKSLEPRPSEDLKKAIKNFETELESVRVPNDDALRVTPLGGIGIFAPFVTDDGDLKRLELDDRLPLLPLPRRLKRLKELATSRDTYANLELFKPSSRWPELVYESLRQEVPDELLSFIAGVGVRDRADRLAVAQIVISIESYFNRFDRMLAHAHRYIQTIIENGFNKRLEEPPPLKDGKTYVFGPPCLHLVEPADIKKLKKAFKDLRSVRQNGGAGTKPAAEDIDLLVRNIVYWFVNVETTLSSLESATARGVTNTRFGLGLPGVDGFGAEHPKEGQGAEHPKEGQGAEHPKEGQGAEHPKEGQGPASGDIASGQDGEGMQAVASLYRQVGDSMKRLERAVSALENVTAAAIAVEGCGADLDAKSRSEIILNEIDRSVGLLCETARNARLTVRSVLAHPVYGLGTGPVPFGLDAREELAARNGLGRRDLKLLSYQDYMSTS